MSPARKRILVVDDEAEVRAILRSAFEIEGYSVFEAGDSAALADILDANAVDLITLDLNLGAEDGLNVARTIRAKRNIPIVMISGKGDTIDRVVGLELGADDYITKPFHMREVLARVRAVLRRYEAGQGAPTVDAAAAAVPARITFDGWTIDPPRREVRTPDGGPCDLTTAEFNLLLLFIERPGRVLSRDEIMDLLKGHDWTPLDRSIDALVARLRKKIEPESDRPQLIKTVRGVGYAFAGTVLRA